MINEARTLLLNASSASRPPLGTDGEEYIPPEYNPLTDPAVISLTNVLFGTAPDPLTQNYRAAQYMNLLHAWTWSEFLLGRDFDPRITYHLRDTTILSATYGTVVTLSTNNFNNAQLWSGNTDRPWVGDDSIGRNKAAFAVNYVTGVGINVTRFFPYSLTVLAPQSLPASVQLDTTQSVNFVMSTGDTTTGANGTWLVNTSARPSRSLTTILSGVLACTAALSAMWSGIPTDMATKLSSIVRSNNRTDNERLAASLLTLTYYMQGVRSASQ